MGFENDALWIRRLIHYAYETLCSGLTQLTMYEARHLCGAHKRHPSVADGAQCELGKVRRFALLPVCQLGSQTRLSFVLVRVETFGDGERPLGFQVGLHVHVEKQFPTRGDRFLHNLLHYS
jgi:hypothetical protein